jgi:hypothetical protein
MPNVEALLKVVEILESTPDEAVDLQAWTCGTTACAIGHAASHPWFIERGFKLSDTGCPVFHQVNGEKLLCGWEAVEEFFGLTGYKYNAQTWRDGLSSQERRDIPPSCWLFNSVCYLAGKKNNMPHKFYQRQQKVGIRQQVINRIKEFVEYGI